jgi:catechol 2,3-dioxygenase-like lactoylglutathione lyase family enzyme
MASIRYMVNDVDKAVTFYTGHLGFEVIERWGPAMAILGKDDLKLWLAGPQSSAAKPMPNGAKPAPGGWNRFVIQVDDLEATVAGMRAAGITFRNDILSGPGGKQILAEDPSGNAIEIFEERKA